MINKSDQKQISDDVINSYKEMLDIQFIQISAVLKTGIESLKIEMTKILPDDEDKFKTWHLDDMAGDIWGRNMASENIHGQHPILH